MITTCKYCGIEVEVDVDDFENGVELQTTCPECGRDFDFIVVKDRFKKSPTPEYYYLDDNNEQNGPMSVESLANVITGSTLVWKEGMSEWKKACDVADLRTIIKSTTPPPIPNTPPITRSVEIPQPEEPEYQPIKPNSNLTLAILCTLLCCIPLGVCAIYYAAKVDKTYYEGDYWQAEVYSEKAKTWSYWGIGLGIALYIIYIIQLNF